MLGACVLLQVLLKIFHFLPLDESGRVNDFLNTGIYVLLDTLILRLQVHHLYLSHCSTKNSTTPG